MARIPYPANTDPALHLLASPLNAFRIMSHATSLTRPAIELGLAILGTTSLPVKVRELVIMFAANHCRCQYEWTQHAPIAIDAGASQAQLDAITQGRLDPALFNASELAALSGATELLTEHTWRAETVTTLRRYYSDRHLVELTITVGYYTMLAGLMNGLDVDVDPSGEHFTAMANSRS